MRELRVALVEEGVHPLLLVVSGETKAKEISLQAKTASEILVERTRGGELDVS